MLFTAALLALPLSSSCKRNAIETETAFYFVYCYQTDGQTTAFSYSVAVDNFGGAGYILKYGNTYYVAAACYYSYGDAEAVCKTLNGRGINCGVLSAERSCFDLTTAQAIKLAREYAATINTLYEISTIIYRCANSVDTAVYTMQNAKSIMQNVGLCIDGLLRKNTDNCFTPYLEDLILRYNDCLKSEANTKHLRAAHIAVADTLLSINLT